MLKVAEQNTVLGLVWFCFVLSHTMRNLKVGNQGKYVSIAFPLGSQAYSCSHGRKMSLFPISLTSQPFSRRKEGRET